MVRQNGVLKEGDFSTLFMKAKEKGWKVPNNCFPKEIAGDFFPDPECIFRAFTLVGPSDVEYVIVGQDPYFTTHSSRDGHKNIPDAIGIAFLIDPDRDSNEPPPPSFQFFEGRLFPEWGEYQSVFSSREALEQWIAQKKVLFLNAALTVPRPASGVTKKRQAVAGQHLKHWRGFVAEMVKQVIEERPCAKLYAFGVGARNVICDGMELAGKFHSCHHPAAHSNSFNEFWAKANAGKLKDALQIT